MTYIGTDVCVRTCREEGYVVVHCPGSWTKRIKDINKEVRVTVSNPLYWPDGINMAGVPSSELYLVDIMVSFHDLLEVFNHYGQDIKEYCEFDNDPLDFRNPTGYTMAKLASIINQWCGLRNWFDD